MRCTVVTLPDDVVFPIFYKNSLLLPFFLHIKQEARDETQIFDLYICTSTSLNCIASIMRFASIIIPNREITHGVFVQFAKKKYL